MSNTFLTPSIIARQALMILRGEVVALGLAYKDKSQEFTAAKVGDEITIRRPAKFEQKEFTSTVDPQNISEGQVKLVLEKHFDITVNVTSKEWSLSLQDFTEQVLRPIIVAHVEGANAFLLSKYTEVYQYLDAAFPTTLAHLTEVPRILDDAKVPMRGRVGLVNPRAKATLLAIPQFTDSEKRGDAGTALREASIGRVLGLDWFMDQQIPRHVKGTYATPATDGAVLAGATTMAVTGGETTQTFKKGDIFKVADAPGQYVVTADTAAVAGDIAALPFFPPAPTGGFETGKALTVIADHDANLVMHPNALAAAIVPLELPAGSSNAQIVRADGMGLRYVAGYNTSNKTDQISLDFLMGAKFVQPELAARVPRTG